MHHSHLHRLKNLTMLWYQADVIFRIVQKFLGRLAEFIEYFMKPSQQVTVL